MVYGWKAALIQWKKFQSRDLTEIKADGYKAIVIDESHVGLDGSIELKWVFVSPSPKIGGLAIFDRTMDLRLLVFSSNPMEVAAGGVANFVVKAEDAKKMEFGRDRPLVQFCRAVCNS